MSPFPTNIHFSPNFFIVANLWAYSLSRLLLSYFWADYWCVLIFWPKYKMMKLVKMALHVLYTQRKGDIWEQGLSLIAYSGIQRSTCTHCCVLRALHYNIHQAWQKNKNAAMVNIDSSYSVSSAANSA